MAKKGTAPKTVETLTHDDKRLNIPTAEYQSVMSDEDKKPIQVAYEQRNEDLDPQLIWRGKDIQDYSELVVNAPPLYIQEKIHPKVLIDDLKKQTEEKDKEENAWQPDLFSDFNGVDEAGAETEFYQHEANWTNRMILGDSLQVMASLAEREGLRGKVQCIYFDPPYGIKFNSNFQWSTSRRDVKDGKIDHITREPEQVKAFRDTWKDGIHSYLTYLRDRLTAARDLLTESGSIFVQIGDENVHRVRALVDEIFGDENYIQTIIIKKKSSSLVTEPVNDFILWSSKNRNSMKVRQLTTPKNPFSEKSRFRKLETDDLRRISVKDATEQQIADSQNQLLNDDYPMVSQDPQEGRIGPYKINGEEKIPGRNRHWTYDPNEGMRRIHRANRLRATPNAIRGVVYLNDFGQESINNIWEFHGERDPIYVVQTNKGIINRCILMTTDPSDIVLDPTCGSGTTAFSAEQWGRRWIAIDTSRVALALARTRIMGARYSYYFLADSIQGRLKEAELSRQEASVEKTSENVRLGFVYERVARITLKGISENAEIDVIHDKFQEDLEPLLNKINQMHGMAWKEWEIPRDVDEGWSDEVKELHSKWWEFRIERQKEINRSIASKAEFEYLYDKPYIDKSKVRVAGPFTVESISPHRTMMVGEDDELIDPLELVQASRELSGNEVDFATMILENLRTAGVQQAHKEDKIEFSNLKPWPGYYVCGEGHYSEGKSTTEKRAAIFIGPEFGTVSRPDLVEAAREAGDAGFDVLIACAFNYDAHASEFDKLGKIPVLKARMNADLHMADDLKNTGKGNLFVIFGEPDVEITELEDRQLQVSIHGVDVFDPSTGEVRSDSADGIACWFIDTDYNGESFFVRHAYFLGANDPYKSLKTSLKAEINQEAWETLNSDVSRPFRKPISGRIAVKVINHLGDEVMKVFRVNG